MDHKEGFFQGVRDVQIYYQAWLPDGQPRAALTIVHGYPEHSGRYGNLVEHMVPLGYALYALDLIGHGRSEGERGYVDRFDDYISPLKTFVDMVCGWQPKVPYFLFGHSMGGLISANYLLEHGAGEAGGGLSGAVLSAPGFRMAEGSSPVPFSLVKVLSALLPRLRGRNPVTNAQFVSRDPQVVQAYVDDPLVYRGGITVRLGAELWTAQRRAIAEASAITLPVLMVHGSEDRLAPLSGAQAFYAALSSTDKTLKVYDGFSHEVCNEPECGMVLSDISDWIEAHL